MMRFILCAAVLIVGTARADTPTPEQNWERTCGYCHGGPMQAPPIRGRGLPEPYILQIARQGADGMPPFHRSELDDADLSKLAKWINQPLPENEP